MKLHTLNIKYNLIACEYVTLQSIFLRSGHKNDHCWKRIAPAHLMFCCFLRWGIERESCEGAFIGRKLEACVSSYVMFIFIFFK